MFDSTLLVQTNTKEEIQKADLDLLRKINELVSIIQELNDRVTLLEEAP